MSDAIELISESMKNDLNRLNTISHNISNVNSTAFKRMINVTHSDGPQSLMNDSNDYLGASNVNISTITDWSQGKIKKTGNILHVAIQGDGYLQALDDQSLWLTRRGELSVDLQGKLVLNSGQAVLGESGEIFLNPGDFKIDRDGMIFQDGRAVDRLSLVTMPEHLIENFGQGFYRMKDSNSVRPAENIQVLQGYIEQSNVDVSSEMVRLLELTRHFEISQKVLKSYDEAIGNAIQQIPEL